MTTSRNIPLPLFPRIPFTLLLTTTTLFACILLFAESLCGGDSISPTMQLNH